MPLLQGPVKIQAKVGIKIPYLQKGRLTKNERFFLLQKKALDKHIKVYHYTKYAIFIVYPPYLYLALGLMVNLLLTPWLLKAECRVGNFTAAK